MALLSELKAIFSELKIADFPGLCVASLRQCAIYCPFYVSEDIDFGNTILATFFPMKAI